jgi:hypothetical protein
VIFHDHAEVGRALGVWRKRRHPDAAGAPPGQVCLVVRAIPKEGGEIGHAVGEAVEPVEQGRPRATGRHGQDSAEVRTRRPEDPYFGHPMVRHARV